MCRIAAGLALALGLFLAAPLYAPSAFAQNPAPSANETVEHSPWQTNFDEQVASILKQEPPRRASSLRVVIEVATSSKDVNLTRTVGSLLDIIERDSNREHRMMAVQALSHIGTEHVAENYYRQAMGQLYALMQSEPSAQVRAAALGTFTQFRNSG